MSTTTRDRVLIVYSAADVAWVRRLKPLLARRLRWWPDELEVNEAVDPVALARASVALVLMSPEVAAWSELPALLEAEQGLRVVRMLIRRSNDAGRPLAEVEEAGEVNHALEEVSLKIASMMAPAALAPPSPVAANARRKLSGWLDTGGPLLGGSPLRRVGARPLVPVHMSASAPRIVKPRQEFTARFAAYHPKLAREVRRRLRAAGLEEHLGLGIASWKPGTVVTVQLSGEGLEVAPASQSFTWGGEHHVIDFDVRAREQGPRYDTRLRFDVSIEGVVLARLRLNLTVAQPRRRGEWSGRRRSAQAVSPRNAFASYATEDRPRVLDRVAAIRIASGVEVFMDCLSLRAGAQWQERLAREISQREVFMLFWSELAANSKWVDWEWRHALRRKGLDAIQPHPLDPWPKAPLPPELSSLHMGDPLMAVREAALTAGLRDRTSAPGASPLPSSA